jgi:protein phosphatase methylesterase 1
MYLPPPPIHNSQKEHNTKLMRDSSFQSRTLDPIPWTTYFERELFLPAADGSVTYHAYLTSPAPPSAAGPGKAAASGGPLFVMHHGAGSSGLSFAVLAAEIRKRLPAAGILSVDARGHGLTTTSAAAAAAGATFSSEGDGPEGEKQGEDLTLPTLAADLLAVLTLTQAAMRWPALPPLILVGHSLGGAVVTEFASVLLPKVRATPPSTSESTTENENNSKAIDLLGYAVLDVVEGSAMDALQSMHAYLATRPAGFESLRDAVEWHVRSRTVRNAVSARASVPGLLVRVPSESQSKPQAQSLRDVGGEGGDGDRGDGEGVEGDGMEGVEGEGMEEEPGVGAGANANARGNGRGTAKGSKPIRWRTDLAKTQPFWEGWFTGLSKKFLGGRGGKMLLLAGTDRLDTELTIGQMQGWFYFLVAFVTLLMVG